MAEQHNPLDALWRWMGEDTASCQALLEEMRMEWECLKKNDLASLPSLLQGKETHMRMIKAHRESMAELIDGFLGDGLGGSRARVLSDLLPFVSPPQAQKIKGYQRAIERLSYQIRSLNERNKRFIQETLTYLDGVFALMTSSQQKGLIYAQGGRTVAATPSPRWMSRKV